MTQSQTPPESPPEIPPEIPPEVLDRMRRSLALRIDALGRWSLGGQPVTHARVLAALWAGLDITEAGETTTQIGGHWGYVTVSDCPLRATGVSMPDPGGGLVLHLDDGRRVPLQPHTLRDEPGRGLRCTVPAAGSGRALAVRFTNAAQMDLLPWLTVDSDGAATLEIQGQRQPIPT